MNTNESLLKRLNEIGKSLKDSKKALALIGLGSVGIELDRMDEFSDLDFFAIVKDGCKNEFIENLDWLSSICPIAYNFKNTPDGHKLLFEDGIFCEFAVFELHELDKIQFSPGRIIWKENFINDKIAFPKIQNTQGENINVDWLIGEGLTNLYVGLCRLKRGEILSATRFIQNYAVDRILILADLIEKETPNFKDGFSPERRFEKRFPEISKKLPDFIQGYDKNIESAKAILNFFNSNFEINQSIKKEIEKLF